MRVKRLITREDILTTVPLREHFAFWEDITPADVTALKRRLRTAKSEEQMQRFLERHPMVLIQHLGGGHGRWVIPKKRLGAEFVPDFVIGDRDSGGYDWTLVELESPTAKMFTKSGLPSRSLNQALRQIMDWRAWLAANRDYATRSRDQQGLELIDISPSPPGLILIGRRSSLAAADRARRKQIERSNNVTIHSYDWLVEFAAGRAEIAKGIG
jgi:hypothetical protein